VVGTSNLGSWSDHWNNEPIIYKQFCLPLQMDRPSIVEKRSSASLRSGGLRCGAQGIVRCTKSLGNSSEKVDVIGCLVGGLEGIPPQFRAMYGKLSRKTGWWWLEPWNFEWLSIQLGMSLSQLTNKYMFQRGRLNHRPDVIGFISGIECEDCMWIENLWNFWMAGYLLMEIASRYV
jgi:hypothetical protein